VVHRQGARRFSDLHPGSGTPAPFGLTAYPNNGTRTAGRWHQEVARDDESL